MSKFKLKQIVYYQIKPGFIVTAKIKEIVKYWDIRLLGLEGIESAQFSEQINKQGEIIIELYYFDTKTSSLINLIDRYEEIKQKCPEPDEDFWSIWIDEPVGYGLQIAHDHIYVSLQEALKNTIKIDSRQSKRKYKKVNSVRNRKIRFINNTRKDDPVDFELNSDLKKYKKIYCNVGRDYKNI